MDTLKVVSLDPGETTGYATGIIEDGWMQVISGQDRWKHIELYTQLNMAKPDMIVCESFEYRNRSRPGLVLYPRELIGIVNLYCQERGDCLLYMQSASAGKSYHKDSTLKSYNLHRPGKPHANDATRHLLHWFTFGPGFKYNKKGFGPFDGNRKSTG